MANNISGAGKISLMKKDKILKLLPQTGEIKSIPRDAGRPAKAPGKRVSEKGNIYWETRKNRSDRILKRL